MAVVSVRLNEKEKKILQTMSKELGMEQSDFIRKSILDSYEDLIDREVIEAFEKKEAKEKIKFYDFTEIISE